MDPVYIAHNDDTIDLQTHIKNSGYGGCQEWRFEALGAEKQQSCYQSQSLFFEVKWNNDPYLVLYKAEPDQHSKMIQEDFTSKFQRFSNYGSELGMTICNTLYTERLRIFKLDSLQRRRERYSIIYMEKIKLWLVPNPDIEFEY